MPRISQKNKIALFFILLGVISGIIFSFILSCDNEKLGFALTGSTALIGAGLTQWSSQKEN